MKEESSSSTASSTSVPPASDAVPAALTTTDGQDLAELLRSMTTTTTIERFDEPPTTTTTTPAVPSIGTALSVEPSPQPKEGPSLPHPSSLPTSITRSYKVLGIPTHTFCQIFSDRIVLGVTQLRTKPSINEKEGKDETTSASPTPKSLSSSGHIGSWVYCQASRSQIDPRQVDYEISTLLGGATAQGVRDEKEIFTRRISERLLEKKVIPGGSDRIVLLLGISLLPISSINRFKVLVEVLVELVEEALGVALGVTPV